MDAPPIFNFSTPTVDVCDDIHQCRTLFQIISPCLTTISLCTWIALHLNVPPPGLSRIKGLWLKLRMLLLALIAPELMLVFAARQYIVARRIVEAYQHAHMTPTHAHFFIMGGFVTPKPDRHPIATMAQLRVYLDAIVAVPEADIKDKSKQDAIAKLLTLGQVLWFVIQTVLRRFDGLPLSALEVVTFAFAGLHMITWWTWKDKPRDVAEAIEIQFHDECMSLTRVDSDFDPEQQKLILHTGSPYREDAAPEPLTIVPHLDGIMFGGYPNYLPTSHTAVPSFWSTDRPPVGYALLGQIILSVVFGLVHCWAWNSSFPTQVEMWMWRTCALWITGCIPMWALLMPVRLSFPEQSMPRRVLRFVGLVLLGAYILSRVILIVLSFTTLRGLPVEIFITVDWMDALSPMLTP
ncbi:hypothetical protein FB45DRAFT_1032782 [Roridomyces roridus]|uniref:Uncharacterized protein n=1 Tax=Roridomyces roridus TaxID=1738132 RepID=A0AAD7BFV2_9AGAR|nr:hypothetical protein FB45DRAFT_1032782 [Roridomyces roridus]